MSLRSKIVLALVALSTLAATAIGVVSYRTATQQTRAEIDATLLTTLGELRGRPVGGGPGRDDRLPRVRAPSDVVVQFVAADGDELGFSAVELPVDEEDLRIASGAGPSRLLRDVSVDGEPFRLLTASVRSGGAVQLARNLSGAEQVLSTLRTRIVVSSLVVIALAALAGWWIASQLTRRLSELTRAAERVAATGQLDVRVEVDGSDETARLATAFDDMLVALDASRAEQRRLVQDAGHELRTPLTSLRTNLFALRRGEQLDDEQRARLLSDLESEVAELSGLVNEVVGVAGDGSDSEPLTDVHLGELARSVAARATSRSGREVEVHADHTVVPARAAMLERAIGNLVENALKFDPGDRPIQIICTEGRVEVRDHGPGIAAEDRPMVFQRFYRADDARSSPGSGLGLAIVADVAARHGGQVFAEQAAGGGAVVGFSIPVRSSP